MRDNTQPDNNPVFTKGLALGFALPKETRPSLSQLADDFVAMFRKTIFAGWPGGVHYIKDDHEPRLRRLRGLLPGRLAQTHDYLAWGYLTTAVNRARAREREAYLKQVHFGADHVGEA